MITSSTSLSHNILENSSAWEEIYQSLRPLARRLVFSFAVPAWRGQEEDIVEDIVQEAARRLIEYTRKVEQGEAVTIHSLDRFMIVIACNCCKDVRRHDRRLVRMISSIEPSEVSIHADEFVHCPSEVAVENAYQEWLFGQIAQKVATFPAKQQRALLIDLANRMYFDAEPTLLQAAFLNVGIRLQEYCWLLPRTPVERARHASLLSQAYKRLALVFSSG